MNKHNKWLVLFQSWGNAERLMALDELITYCEPTQVRHMMQVIEPQFQRDFISLLPKEVSLIFLWMKWLSLTDIYSKCSKILNAGCLPTKAKTDSADPDQTASEEAVWSGSSLFAILTSFLRIPALKTNILFENNRRKVLVILEYLPYLPSLSEILTCTHSTPGSLSISWMVLLYFLYKSLVAKYISPNHS